MPSLDRTAASNAERLQSSNEGQVLDTVPKVKLKYQDRDGDYVTILDRTEMSEIVQHAVSFHVYLLQVIRADRHVRKQTLEGLVDII